jgi:hypothetical protein
VPWEQQLTRPLQVIDAEMARRKLLEATPIPSINEEPVLFDTGEIPWWAWVRRFHLPEVRTPVLSTRLLATARRPPGCFDGTSHH